MKECGSLKTVKQFVIWEKKKSHWYSIIQFPICDLSITINGNSLKEIKEKKLNILSELRETYPETEYEIKVYNL